MLASLLLCVLIFSGEASGGAYTVGGRWLFDGEGFIERSLLRVSLSANGTLDIKSAAAGNAETISGYEVWGELNASRLGINAWSYHGEHSLAWPVAVGEFNPTLSEPYTLPSFSIDKLTYTVEFTSVNSGTVKIRGFVDIDMVGECEVNADCALWRQGTKMPETPGTGSGCETGAGAVPAAALLAAFMKAKGKRRAV
jgi:hypothetical protein